MAKSCSNIYAEMLDAAHFLNLFAVGKILREVFVFTDLTLSFLFNLLNINNDQIA